MQEIHIHTPRSLLLATLCCSFVELSQLSQLSCPQLTTGQELEYQFEKKDGNRVFEGQGFNLKEKTGSKWEELGGRFLGNNNISFFLFFSCLLTLSFLCFLFCCFCVFFFFSPFCSIFFFKFFYYLYLFLCVLFPYFYVSSFLFMFFSIFLLF